MEQLVCVPIRSFLALTKKAVIVHALRIPINTTIMTSMQVELINIITFVLAYPTLSSVEIHVFVQVE